MSDCTGISIIRDAAVRQYKKPSISRQIPFLHDRGIFTVEFNKTGPFPTLTLLLMKQISRNVRKRTF